MKPASLNRLRPGMQGSVDYPTLAYAAQGRGMPKAFGRAVAGANSIEKTIDESTA